MNLGSGRKGRKGKGGGEKLKRGGGKPMAWGPSKLREGEGGKVNQGKLEFDS